MREVEIQLTLQDDVVFSERSASQGAHACLDYVPGSALLGWAASRLYASLSLVEAWLVFHSGKVRFGNGLPLAGNGLTGFPMPLCLHYEKATDWKRGGRILAEQVFNTCYENDGAGRQMKQLRDGFVAEDGMLHNSAKALTMKTAINPQTGRAADAQLFGYEALQAGQEYIATLSSDDDVPEELFNKVKDVCNGLMHLGRSRSTQYGRVVGKVKRIISTADGQGSATQELLLWVLSDMALERHGQPVMNPETADMGLPKGRLVSSKSFIRSRRYAPFNGKRRAPDLERQVIRAGSILYFRMDKPVDPSCLPTSFGMFRECGLGVVCINHPLLSAKHPVLQKKVVAAKQAPVQRPSHPLVQWLIAQESKVSAGRAVRDRVDELFGELECLYETASSLAAQPVGPGKSQWGRVRELAMHTSGGDALHGQLFGNSGVCKEKNNEDWIATGQTRDGKFITFRDWLMTVTESELGKDLPQILSLLAQQATDYVAKQKEFA